VVRKFVEPALELMMLDEALRGEFDREALLIFGEMYATALAGNGHVEPDMVKLTVGGELDGGAALLRLAALHLLNQLLPDELKFDARIYMGEGRYYNIAAYGEDAARLKRLLAVSAPSAGGRYLSEKFDKFVKEARVEVRLDKDSIKRTKKGRVVADLTVSDGGVAVKYNVYLLKNAVELHFASTDRSRVELAERLLRLAGVTAKVSKVGNRDVWRVEATTDMLATGHEELRKALAEVVETAVKKGWVDSDKAERWLEKLEKGLTLKEGWPKYEVGLTRRDALKVRFSSTNSGNIEREMQRLRQIGLEEGRHFTVKMPEGGKAGYVSILREGLEHAAWLSVNGSGRQQELATDFVKHILKRAEEKGEKVYDKVRKIIEGGTTRGSLTLKGFEKEVEVDGRKHMVKVIGWSTELEKSQSGKLLLRIKITAEVGDVKSEYTITYGRYERDAAKGFSVARAEDAERLAAVVKAITGKEPRIIEKSNGTIVAVYGSAHLKGFMHYKELADAIKEWLEKTRR